MRNILWQRIGYKPHDEQALVHRAIARGAKRVACVWGRRSGKSIMAATELLTDCSFAPSGSLPYRIIRITAPESDIVERIFAYLWRWIVTDKIFGIDPVRKSDARYYIDMPWGVKIEGKTTKEPTSLLGDGVAITACDEHAQDKADILQRYIVPPLLDLDGVLLLTSTPNGLHNHLRKTYLDWEVKMHEGNPRYYASNVTSYANTCMVNYQAFIDEIDSIKIECDLSGIPEIFEQEYMARFTALSGAVYPMFNRATHVRDIDVVPNVPLTIGIDWGYRNPFVCLFAQILNDGTKINVLDEIYQSGLTDIECVDMVRNKIAELGLKYDIGFADPSSPEAIQTFNDNGIEIYRPSSKCATRINAVGDGILRVRKRLSRGTLYLSPMCKNLIRELESYIMNDRADGEKPVKVDDHAPDALRYLISGNEISGGELNVTWI